MKPDKLEQALELLWKRSRFASYFYQSVHFAPETRLPTLALMMVSSRLVLYYRPSFLESLSLEELIGLLVHEMMHVVLSHNHREYPEDNLYLQNVAQDMVVNSYLYERQRSFFSRQGDYAAHTPVLVLPAGLPRVPGDFVRDAGIADPSWEEVFRWLKSLSREQRREIIATAGFDPGFRADAPMADADRLNKIFGESPIGSRSGDNRMNLELWDSRGMAFLDDSDTFLPTGVHFFESRDLTDQRDAKRNHVLSMAGNDRECLEERAFGELRGIIQRAEKRDIRTWERLLKSVVDYSSQSSEWAYTYGRFNRRYFTQGIYAPGRIFRERELITVAVDVSGSMVMNPGDIEAAFGVIESLMDKYRVHLVCLDENLFVPEKREDRFLASREADKPYVYMPGDWRYICTGSGGTTFFAPLFNRHMKGHGELLMIITDGYIYDLDRLKPYHPTLWVITAGRKDPFTPPFGQSVHME